VTAGNKIVFRGTGSFCLDCDMTDRDAQENLAHADGLWTALALFVAVLFFLGLAAYLYWSGTGKLPWS
jgi:hypothetical protein